MLSISTRDLRLLRTLAKTHFRIRRQQTRLQLIVRTDHRDLLLQIRWQGFGIQLRLSNAADEMHPELAFTLPLDNLVDALRPRRGAVHFAIVDSTLQVSWTDRGVPRRLQLPLEEPAASQSLPELPRRMHRMPAWFAESFVLAASVTNRETVRYALSCVQLDAGNRRLVATDGVQAFSQSGLDLPWDGEVLLPASVPIGHRELPAAPIEIGRTTVSPDIEGQPPQSDSVLLRIGRWSFWAPVESGRFPDVDRVVPRDVARTRLALDRLDAVKLAESIDGLPGEADDPVTLRLDEQVVVVAESGEERAELGLGRSRTLGEPAVVSMRRSFLKRAAAIGFDEIGFHGDGRPAVCHEAGDDCLKQYVWMTLAFEATEPAATTPAPVSVQSASAA